MLQQLTQAPVSSSARLFANLVRFSSCGRQPQVRQAVVTPQAYQTERPQVRRVLQGSKLQRTSTEGVSLRAVSSGLSGDSDLYLIVYSKPGCHLCDGLKEKIQAVLDKAMFQPSPLSNARLQVRNILDKPEWEQAYGMVIPVMTAIKRGESEEIKIPRAPPRITAERLHDHIVRALQI